MLNVLAFVALGLFWIAVPLGGVAYLSIVAGRRLAGRVGMKLVATGLALMLAVLLWRFGAALGGAHPTADDQPRDVLGGVVMLGALTLNTAIGLGGAIFFGWAGQWHRVRGRKWQR